MGNNMGHCSNRPKQKKKGRRERKKERETWTLHHWATTLDITTAVGIASMDNNIGQQPWTLQPLTTIMLWILHQWTTTWDIAAIDNKKKDRKEKERKGKERKRKEKKRKEKKKKKKVLCV